MASMTDTYTYNVYRNALAVVRLKNEFKVTIHDTPKDIFPAFIKSTNTIYEREVGEERLLQGSARVAARLRQDRRAVLDEDQRAVLQPRLVVAE